MTYVIAKTHRFYSKPDRKTLACLDDLNVEIARFATRAEALAWIAREERRRCYLLDDEQCRPTYSVIHAAAAPAWAVALGA